jgi:hypothetical protein
VFTVTYVGALDRGRHLAVEHLHACAAALGDVIRVRIRLGSKPPRNERSHGTAMGAVAPKARVLERPVADRAAFEYR